MPGSDNEVTRLLREWRGGSEEALEELLPHMYADLRRLARRHLRGERPGHTLQPTALAAHHSAAGVLEILDSGAATQKLDAAGSFEGRFFGPYQFLQRVSESGMDPDEIIRRFHTERQILASLDHPDFARLLDGGTTEEGGPYFAVDYIEGTPLYRYCDENRLSIRERISLFRDLCATV